MGFDFTQEERRIMLFLMSMALIGISINFAIKVNPHIERFTKADYTASKINVNQATYEDLLGIKGISPNLAKNIIAYRNNYGPFKESEELKEVKGIGEFKYKKIKEYLTLE